MQYVLIIPVGNSFFWKPLPIINKKMKSKEECLLFNGIMGTDLGKNEKRIFKAMDDHTISALDEIINSYIPDGNPEIWLLKIKLLKSDIELDKNK